MARMRAVPIRGLHSGSRRGLTGPLQLRRGRCWATSTTPSLSESAQSRLGRARDPMTESRNRPRGGVRPMMAQTHRRIPCGRRRDARLFAGMPQDAWTRRVRRGRQSLQCTGARPHRGGTRREAGEDSEGGHSSTGPGSSGPGVWVHCRCSSRVTTAEERTSRSEIGSHGHAPGSRPDSVTPGTRTNLDDGRADRGCMSRIAHSGLHDDVSERHDLVSVAPALTTRSRSPPRGDSSRPRTCRASGRRRWR
jgi:hypothetical protein